MVEKEYELSDFSKKWEADDGDDDFEGAKNVNLPRGNSVIDRWKKLPRKKKLIIGVIISLLIVVFGGGIISLVSLLNTDGGENGNNNIDNSYISNATNVLIVKNGGVAGDNQLVTILIIFLIFNPLRHKLIVCGSWSSSNERRRERY